MRSAIACVALLALSLSVQSGAQAPGGRVRAPLKLSPISGLDEFIPTPDDNPLTADKVALGQRLFFDRRLSLDASISCASCHQPGHAFADTAPRSRGVGGHVTRRNAPSIVNRAYGRSFFWDGRAGTLEEQVLRPIEDTLEMALPIEQAVKRLAADASYRSAFGAAFDDGMSSTNIARALASYVRTIRSGNTPVDRFRVGDTAALSVEARRGLALFSGKANCAACHLAANLTDERFHNTGVFVGTADLGRYAVTGNATDRGAFKTPTLRDVALTAPYMHDGSLATLDAVMEFYARGGSKNPNLDSEIHPLALSVGERHDVVAFLHALTTSANNDSFHPPGTDRIESPPRMLVANAEPVADNDVIQVLGGLTSDSRRDLLLKILERYGVLIAAGVVGAVIILGITTAAATIAPTSDRHVRR